VDASYAFAKNFAETRYEQLSPEIIEITKKQILDLFGVAVGGFSKPGPQELRELILEWGGKEESSVIGLKEKVPAPNAAHVNATMVHALDFDDVHEAAVMHPGVIAIPTAMAVGQRVGRLTGKDLLTATVLGTDIMCRLGLAACPGRSPIDVGWHQTTLYGFVGAAAVAGKIMGLSETQIIDAMGIGYHQCAGNGQAVKDGALTKRLGPGFSVKGGITAALLAGKGVTGAHNCLDGDWGLFKLYWRGDYDPSVLVAEIGKRFETVNVSIKPYPCCRGIHPAIDAAFALVEEFHIQAENIEKLKVYVTDAHIKLLCTPLDAKRQPRSPVDAQFSIPWGVATALVKGRATLDDFSDAGVLNADVLAISSKIDVEVDTALSRGDKIEPTRVEITTKGGTTYSKVEEHPLGSPERPMSYDDVARKFRGCAGLLPTEQQEKVIDFVSRLEKVEDASEIFTLLQFNL
jgi:2-methylcitrate dehydratase PrpD